MDRDFLIDLFADFGPVTIRRMFSGFGISADGTNFALALRGGLYFRADDQTIARFEAEGSQPFQYQTRTKTVTVGSYWQLPERLYDDPQEMSEWARAALAAATASASVICALTVTGKVFVSLAGVMAMVAVRVTAASPVIGRLTTPVLLITAGLLEFHVMVLP